MRRLFASPQRIADSDFLRREISTRMHERLALVRLTPERIVDAGCGGGADLAVLQARFAEAKVLGIDGSLAMARHALESRIERQSSMQRMLGKWLPGAVPKQAGPTVLCGDFARLPLPTHAADLIWSNLALHWHPQPDLVFAEWRRVLRVDGLLMFSCFGPDTFKEIRAAFAQVDEYPHTLNFVDMHDLGDMLVNSGFSTPVMDMETITVTYESTDKLLADVRAWGGNPLLTRRRGLLDRSAKAQLLHVLDTFRRPDGKIPLTFEVVYGHAFRPAPTRTADGESIIRFDLPRKRQ